MEHRKLRWKIFDQEGALTSREIEKRQREGILSIMYAKRLQEQNSPGVTMRELEGLLDCAREHLEFSLWYLRERGRIEAGDSGLFWITVSGVDWCNETDANRSRKDQEDESRRLMIEAGRRNGNEDPLTNANGHEDDSVLAEARLLNHKAPRSAGLGRPLHQPNFSRDDRAETG